MTITNKKMRILSCFFVLFVLAFPVLFSFRSDFKAYAIDNESEIVMEKNTNRVLFEKNSQKRKFMASTTKILTAITIIENCNIDQILTVSKKSVGVEGSSIYLEEGEKLSVKDLLYGLMLRSGNDCAETLALHCSGSLKAFSALMNKTARSVGALNSNFVNPHGLHDENHYTTAYDLALISCHAMKNEIFRQIVSTKKIKIPFTTRNTVRVLINKNKMLFNMDGANGIKTGYTKKAGRCLVSSCVRNGMELISVVLNCPPMFERSEELLNMTFEHYKLYKILESDYIVGFIDSKNSKKIPTVIKNDVILPLTEKEKDNLKIQYDLPEKLSGYLKVDVPVGKIKIFYANNLLFEEKIYIIL